jgi:hypothetical protein
MAIIKEKYRGILLDGSETIAPPQKDTKLTSDDHFSRPNQISSLHQIRLIYNNLLRGHLIIHSFSLPSTGVRGICMAFMVHL